MKNKNQNQNQNIYFKYLFILIVFFTSIKASICCDPISIIGNWYYWDTDTSYCEVYINDSLLSYNCDNFFTNTFYYSMENDSIFLIPANNTLVQNVKIKILEKKPKIMCWRIDNNIITLFLIEQKIPNIFLIENDDFIQHHNFFEQFFRRRDSLRSMFREDLSSKKNICN